jgi:hypothetical protein
MASAAESGMAAAAIALLTVHQISTVPKKGNLTDVKSAKQN